MFIKNIFKIKFLNIKSNTILIISTFSVKYEIKYILWWLVFINYFKVIINLSKPIRLCFGHKKQ